MGQAVARIQVRQGVCSGCRACEVACVAQHEGRFGTAAARIHVVKIEASGVDEPHVCRLCGHAPCVEACPTGALYRDDATGAVLLSAERCSGCSACVDACPFGVATLHPATGLALICDLCGGDPACVKRCATGAIRVAGPAAGAPAPREERTR
jgi:carbon-monoxide dehydrogenase iron sulfur subunit